MNHEQPRPVAAGTPHGQYRVTTTVWLQHDELRWSTSHVVQCTCQGPHTSGGKIEAERVTKGGITTWVIDASGPDPSVVTDQSTSMAKALVPFLSGDSTSLRSLQVDL